MYREACQTAGVQHGKLNERVFFATQHQKESILNEFTHDTMLDAKLHQLPSDIPVDGLEMVAHKVMLHMALK